MNLVTSPEAMQRLSRGLKNKKQKIGLVPTMGCLHLGHLSLIRQARKDNDYVVVSIFVNPAQFGPKEDLKRYPRPFSQDKNLCKKENVDCIFYPKPADMYPLDYKTYIEVEGLSHVLCGKSRPGHFRGVATVVNKLFNLVGPDVAYFGQKDAQQVAVIKRMVKDLNLPIGVKVMPIVREKDGLAMSSRNIYLGSRERHEVGVLFKSLKAAQKLIKRGERNKNKIVRMIRKMIQNQKDVCIDYVEIVDAKTLEDRSGLPSEALIALAVRFGKTRLIDNLVISSK